MQERPENSQPDENQESASQGRVLAIGRSDCLCRAGVQGDVRTVTELGGLPSTVVTVVTADDTNQAFDWVELPPTIIVRQLERILKDQGVDCIKIGQLHSEEQIDIVSNTLERLVSDVPLVVSPVLVSHDGRPRLSVRAASALKRRMLILASVLCLSVREAEVLTGMEIRDEDMLTDAAFMLLTLGSKTVFVHGGDFGRDKATDILATENDVIRFDDGLPAAERLLGAKTTISAAIATGIAQGMTILDAVIFARKHLQSAVPVLEVLASQVDMSAYRETDMSRLGHDGEELIPHPGELL